MEKQAELGQVVLGGQWGDEGKGKIVDYMTEKAHVVVRFQGGNNAGHTLYLNQKKYVLHLIPSGCLYSDKVLCIGNGVVIDPLLLKKEMKGLIEEGIGFQGRLYISALSHIIFRYHRGLDIIQEFLRKNKIGTTGRGIGPCYADKYSRQGVRFCDLLGSRLEEIIRTQCQKIKDLFKGHWESLQKERDDIDTFFDADAICAELEESIVFLKPYIFDVDQKLRTWHQEGRKIIYEGAQGTLLDVDFGTYPFVTSSSPSAGAVSIGTGVPPSLIGDVFIFIKVLYNACRRRSFFY